VYDEVFQQGQLRGRYWSATGTIKPERALEGRQDAFDLLPAGAFSLQIDDSVLDRGWRWVAAHEIQRGPTEGRHVVVELAHATRPITVRVHTRFDGSPFLVRWLEIGNGAAQPVSLAGVAPFAGLLWWLQDYTGDLQADGPLFSLGYYTQSAWDSEGDFAWEALRPGTKTVEGRMGRSGHGRPSFVLRNLANGEVFVGELAWSSNWRYEVTVGQDEPRKNTWLQVRIGPFAADPTLRVIDAGETITTPAVHIGHLHADLDGWVQAVHRHVRSRVLPPQLPGKHQLIEANHRGYISDHEDEEGIKREIDIAAAVGAELFVIDAGWYGREPNRWARNVGDWHAGPWLPNDLQPIIEHAHQKGLLFGLWVEIESIGANSRLLEEHPDWVLTRHGQPVSGGRHLDVAKPEVAAWMEAELVRIISTYRLDHFRLDYNTLAQEGGTRIYGGFFENTLWRHAEAIWGIFARLRARFPQVLFENCASGGGRLDLGMLRYFQITEITDWMLAPRALKILNGLTLHLPPEICLRTVGTEVPDHDLYGDVAFQLRASLFGQPILRGIAPTLEQIGEPRRSMIVHALSLYKEFIRPILPDARVYHHTPILRLDDAQPWCVLEYAAPDGSCEVAGIFRLTAPDTGCYSYRPRGLRAGRRYRVQRDNTGEVLEIAGLELQREGIPICLESPLTSELLLIEAL
jgi:alpha-galactosidase